MSSRHTRSVRCCRRCWAAAGAGVGAGAVGTRKAGCSGCGSHPSPLQSAEKNASQCIVKSPKRVLPDTLTTLERKGKSFKSLSAPFESHCSLCLEPNTYVELSRLQRHPASSRIPKRRQFCATEQLIPHYAPEAPLFLVYKKRKMCSDHMNISEMR